MHHCPLVRRARLILYKALTLSGLVLAAMLLSSPAARAGHWEFTCTGSGKVTTTYCQYGIDRGQPSPTEYNWVAPTAPQSGSFNLGGAFGGGSDYAVSAVAAIKVTVTATWKPDSASDPAPPDVWLCESSRVDWSYGRSGTLQDGFSDPAVANQGTFGQTASTSPGTSIPPALWTKVSVSGGTAKLPERTFSAEADSPDFPFGDLCIAHIDDYSVTVHATPYNFRRTNFDNQTPPTSVVVAAGELQFSYWRSSTSGNMSDLSGETIHENVDAPSSPSVNDDKGVPHFGPDFPPFNWLVPFHSDPVSVSGNASGMTDDHAYGDDPVHLDPSVSFHKPYKADSFDLTQTYKFNDPTIMASGTEQIIPGNAGPFTITDAVVADSNSPSGYSFQVSKDGATSLLQPLPQ